VADSAQLCQRTSKNLLRSADAGDEPIQLIHLPQDFKLSTDRAATLFPEAQTFRGGYVF
jgi:hypothetical protein